MRVRPAPASPLYPKLRFAFTAHPITVWAGVILLRLYVELLDLRTALTRVLTPVAKTSNHQIPVVDILLAWWYGLALGAERFEHLTRYRRDPLQPRRLGLPRFRSPDTVRRFFGRFTYRHTTEVSEALMRSSLGSLRPTLSLDTFCLQSFDATDAAFRTGCVLYNLLMGFRETVLPSCWFERRLRAVRDLGLSGRGRSDPQCATAARPIRGASGGTARVPPTPAHALRGAPHCGAVGVGAQRSE